MNMLAVENYFNIDSKQLDSYLKNKNTSELQGRNLLLKKDIYDLDKLKDFFESVFNFVNKIAVEDENITYIISDKFEEKVIEPFNNLEYKNEELDNDIILMSNFICSLNKKHKYDI